MHVLSALEEWAVQGLAPAHRRQGLAAVRFSVGLAPWGALFAVTFASLGLPIPALSLVVACLGVGATAVVLRGTRSTVATAHWLAAFLGQCLLATAWWTGGLISAALPWFAVCGVVTMIVGGVRAAVGWLGLASLALLGLTVLDVTGHVPASFLSRQELAVVAAMAHTALFAVAVALAYAAVSVHEQIRSDLDDARVAAVSANQAKSDFLSRMSHELRTPLNAIIGYSELLEEEADGHVARDLAHIRTAGRHLLHMVNDVLDLAKIESGHLDLELEAVEIRPLIEGLVEQVAPLVAKRNNRAQIEVSGAPVAWADAVRLRQCLLNLLANAAKFTSDGEIRVLAREVEALVVVEVHDTGIGMTAPQLARVFDPFVQADAAIGRAHGGTGLGLAIVRRIVEQLGGSVTAQSTPGAGSVFTLTVPRVREEPRRLTPLGWVLSARRGGETPR